MALGSIIGAGIQGGTTLLGQLIGRLAARAQRRRLNDNLHRVDYSGVDTILDELGKQAPTYDQLNNQVTTDYGAGKYQTDPTTLGALINDETGAINVSPVEQLLLSGEGNLDQLQGELGGAGEISPIEQANIDRGIKEANRQAGIYSDQASRALANQGQGGHRARALGALQGQQLSANNTHGLYSDAAGRSAQRRINTLGTLANARGALAQQRLNPFTRAAQSQDEINSSNTGRLLQADRAKDQYNADAATLARDRSYGYRADIANNQANNIIRQQQADYNRSRDIYDSGERYGNQVSAAVRHFGNRLYSNISDEVRSRRDARRQQNAQE